MEAASAGRDATAARTDPASPTRSTAPSTTASSRGVVLAGAVKGQASAMVRSCSLECRVEFGVKTQGCRCAPAAARPRWRLPSTAMASWQPILGAGTLTDCALSDGNSNFHRSKG